EGGVSGIMSVSDYRRVRPLARKARVRMRVTKRRGLPFAVRKYRGRLGLFVGAALGAVLIAVLSQFLWSYRILGADSMSEQQIRRVLAENGISIGTYLDSLDVEPIERHILRDLDGITWVSVNIMGCTADVEVRQKAQKPEIQSMEPCNIVASADGVITKLKVREGFAAVKEGSGVAKGELIVSGFNPTKQGGVRYMHADADIYADVISERELKIPKQYDYYSITENKIDRMRLRFLWFELPASLSFGNCPYRAVTVRDNSLVLNGTVLPVGTSVETSHELEQKHAATDKAAAREIFRNDELLYEAFSRPDSRPVSRSLTVSESKDGFSCEFNCVFNENIAETAEFSVTED
ncbi:MAG: sporulation protein YqfD, partial [Ruminococcus sp.]|nr:sporulation protein YqfD [Ruminococcus sp.]